MTPQQIAHTRLDLELISTLIAENSTVLDLGCGDGDLLQKLLHEKNVKGHGVEIYDKYIYRCIEKGVPVIHADIDEGLDDYPDKSFDYVILSRTLQVVRKPHLILKEMLRVGKTCIISFPNFGYWKIRLFLLGKGKMPISKLLPYQWYDTPNIHLSTIKDIKGFCKWAQIKIREEIYIKGDKKGRLLANLLPNLFSELAIFMIEKEIDV